MYYCVGLHVSFLRNSGVGCHLRSSFVGAIMFADDLALLAPSRSAIQQMMAICETFCKKYCRLSLKCSLHRSNVFWPSPRQNRCLSTFLVAFTRLYTPLCRSIGRSVTHLLFRRFSGSFCITAPAQSHATDSAVYTALLKEGLLERIVC